MSRTDFEWIGRVNNIKKNSGEKNGRQWVSTSFLLTRPKVINGEQRNEKWLVSGFIDLNVTEGDLFRVGIDLERRKKYNSEEWETVLVARWAEFYPEGGDAPKRSTPTSPVGHATTNFSNQKPQTGFSSPQKQTYSAPKPHTTPSGEGGPEDFVDDIPF